jgi:hypothetical protein
LKEVEATRCRTLLLPLLLTLLQLHTTELRRVTTEEAVWRVCSALKAMVAVVVCRKPLVLLECDLDSVETAREQQDLQPRAGCVHQCSV